MIINLVQKFSVSIGKANVDHGVSNQIMIKHLENSDKEVAMEIYRVFQSSYKIEADLIGVDNFPPLSRTREDIAHSETSFYGFFENNSLASVIEIMVENNQLRIYSLTVDPNHFRKGIAGKVINYVLDSFEYNDATVETAVVNEPAIKLYRKHGFVEFKRWTPSHGIKKLAMAVKHKVKETR